MPKDPALREVKRAEGLKAKPTSGKGRETDFPTPVPGQNPFYRGPDNTPKTRSNT